MKAPVLDCGDPHGQFAHIVRACAEVRPSAVILLGDMEPASPLADELAGLEAFGVLYWFIPGNHDADDATAAARVFDPALAGHNANGRVVTLPDGTRLAGLGGVFREAVWNPRRMAGIDSSAKFKSRAAPRTRGRLHGKIAGETVRTSATWGRSTPTSSISSHRSAPMSS